MPYAYSNNGLSLMWHDATEEYVPKAGEIMSPALLSTDDISSQFSGYAVAAAAAQAPALFAGAVAGGLAIMSTVSPSINGTYGCTQQDEINLIGLQASVLSAVTWIGYYRDINGRKITMTAAQFTEIATAIMGFIAALDNAYETALAGDAATWPPATAAIA